MYAIYSFLLFLSMLFYIPAYFVKHRLIRKTPLFLARRLGFYVPQKLKSDSPSIWIHAVSVGEVLSLQRLLETLKRQHPDWRIYFSTLTVSGMKMAQEKLSAADEIFFVPLDFRGAVKRFFRTINPDLFVLAESEFWPNLIRAAGERTRGVILINGRISPKSAGRYRRLKPVIKKILAPVNRFLVQTKKDGERLTAMGIGDERIEVAGNLKAEILLPVLSVSELENIRNELGLAEENRVVVAGSTHRGEESILLRAFAAVQILKPELRLILAPRHIERSAEVEKICREHDLKFRRKTEAEGEKEWDVLILDTIGELSRIYAVSDLSFIGGSLIPWGGQNLLEPSFYGKPVFFGPHMHNFEHLAELFVEEGAARIMRTRDDLEAMFQDVDKDELSDMGRRGRALLSSLQGATSKTLKAIEEMMGLERRG